MEPQHSRNAPSLADASSSGKRRHAMRLLHDEHEEIVLVYELTGLTESDPRMLVLEWGGGRKISRFESYPANWRQLHDSALLALRTEDS